MAGYEVPDPILNNPYEVPRLHWVLEEGRPPVKQVGRRPAGYWYRAPGAEAEAEGESIRGQWEPLPIVNLIRERLAAWRPLALRGEGGVTRTTCELLNWWRREGREKRLFFAQLEAAEAIVFLTEARADFLQGISIPADEPTERQKAEGSRAFRREALKMATGSGKTTVMGMIAAWSILNKVHGRSDGRFSDAVLVLCPNVTIRNRLAELDPQGGDASLYRTRDLVPPHLMTDLAQGQAVITNWHVFEPQIQQVGGVSARVSKAGRREDVRETITIGARTTLARGTRYLTPEEYQRQTSAGLLVVEKEERDSAGNLKRAIVRSSRYVESDTALIERVLARRIGGKKNLLVFNDEAHHAYRIRREPAEETSEEDEEDDDDEILEAEQKEATVWVEGLDRIHAYRGINLCVDLSATPYYLARVGQQANRTFPWVVSDFGLTDAIESGLVKIPQLAVRDNSGNEHPEYFNIWRWILGKLTSAERGGKRGSPKPEAVLKWAHTPVAMLGGLWTETVAEWAGSDESRGRPPVFIVVCKNTRIAKVVHRWLAGEEAPSGIPPAGIEGLRNREGQIVTIRVDTKVVQETDSDTAKSDESRWMRLTLDTVGRIEWPRDRQGSPIYPEGFEDLAKKLGRPLHPPGRNIRCIVSVGMLTEGWDCNTVTHIIGLRPFMSQLLCEQVVGRGLRRASYEPGEGGLLREEVAKVLGVPFEVIPFKEDTTGKKKEREQRNHVSAIPQKAAFEIRFPRVEGYRQAVRNRVTIDWSSVATVVIDPLVIPNEVQMKATLSTNRGRPTLLGPGKIDDVTLNPFRKDRRLQHLAFELARDLVRGYVEQPECTVPAHVLFPQVQRIVERYLRERVHCKRPAETIDAFLSPWYGWIHEQLLQAIRPDTSQGEAPELPQYERNREAGTTADVSFWTGKNVIEVLHSHVNYVVADTKKWEQAAAYRLDRDGRVDAFVKNEQLGFTIPYLHNGQSHDYVPDFLVRLKAEGSAKPPMLILETKGYDPLRSVKAQAAERWVAAVSAEGSFGIWIYRVANAPDEVSAIIDSFAAVGGNA